MSTQQQKKNLQPHLKIFNTESETSRFQLFCAMLQSVYSFFSIPSFLHLVVVRNRTLPSGQEPRVFPAQLVVGQRGIEPAEETPERETEAQLERGRRVNEGLMHIHLAFITQTEKVMVSEGRQTEGLYMCHFWRYCTFLSYFDVFLTFTKFIYISKAWNRLSKPAFTVNRTARKRGSFFSLLF